MTFYATKNNLLHHSQYGGIPNHRTTDHIFTMISNISPTPTSTTSTLTSTRPSTPSPTKPFGKCYTATTSPNTLFLSSKIYTLIPLTIPPSTASLSLPP